MYWQMTWINVTELTVNQMSWAITVCTGTELSKCNRINCKPNVLSNKSMYWELNWIIVTELTVHQMSWVITVCTENRTE